MAHEMFVNRVMNKEIFKVVEEVWQKGGGKLGLPTRVNMELPAGPTFSYKAFGENGALYASVRAPS